MGAGAAGTDLRQPDLVDPRHRATAGANGRHAHHRHHDRHAADVLAGARAGPAVLDDGDVGAGAAHVEGDDVRPPRLRRDVGGADHARGRPRQQRRHRVGGGGGHRHDAAVRLGDVGGGRHAAGGERFGEPGEIAAHLRLHVGVEHGQRRPLVLASLRPHLRRRAHREPRRRALGDRPHPALVGGVAIGVEQRDHQPLDLVAGQAAHGGVRARLVERGVDGAVRAPALAHLGHPRARHQGQGTGAVQIERVRQAQALQLEHVAEALGDEEAEAGAGALDERVHRDGGAVHHRADLAGVDAVLVGQTPQPRAHRLREVGRRRRHLEPEQLAGPRVEDGEVGEGATDIDAEPEACHASFVYRAGPAKSTARDPPTSASAPRAARRAAPARRPR